MKIHWILSLSGMAAAIWMLIGVVVVARMLPGYSHANNLLSELGAKGKPTEKIHLFINNYPIGLLFILFGGYLLADEKSTQFPHFVGVLICIHGFCHFLTGFFPCEADLGIAKTSPSKSHKVHSLSGLVMQLTLLVASGFLFFSDAKIPTWLRWFSLVSAVASILFFILMVKSFSRNYLMGLYQRLSFGSLVVWVATLSWLSYVSS